MILNMKKVYVIFGGSGGMGLECAKRFSEGLVVIVDINQQALDKAKLDLESLGIETHIEKCDITNREEVAKIASTAAALGELTAVINSAGISASGNNGPLIMKVDLIGTAILLEAFLPHARPHMTMVCIASMLGYLIPKNEVYNSLLRHCLEDDFMEKIRSHIGDDANKAYSLAKRGVQLLCEKQDVEWGKKGARIVSISPGVIETPMAKEVDSAMLEHLKQMTPLKRYGTSEEIADLVAFLCSDKASFITGCDIKIDGGLVNQMMATSLK